MTAESRFYSSQRKLRVLQLLLKIYRSGSQMLMAWLGWKVASQAPQSNGVDIKTMTMFKVSGGGISIGLGTYEVTSQVFLHSFESWKLQFSVTKFPDLQLQEKQKATSKPKSWTSSKIIITKNDSAVVTVSDNANSTFGTKTGEFHFKKWRIAHRNQCEWHLCGVQNTKRNCFLFRYINKNFRVLL